MILALILLILRFLNKANAETVVITECHNGGVEVAAQNQISRRPVPSASACRDNDQSGLCNALFPINDALATNADP
ncbi:unnamed protein product [Dracunculus medinensis]|uniref:Secreted protein n=1 Tax=Dracunculus medinensis TaxID=318479 RepID=A0A0N4UPR6_DRAME|nr:unnamed protein product [Dracunculus medinensis]